MRISRSVAPLVLAALVSTSLIGCASGDAPEPTASAPAEAPAETESTAEATDEATDEATAEPDETKAPAASGDLVTPAWAAPATSPGELLTSVDGSNFKVDIYQVGTAAATSTGSFVDAETNTPLIEVGDEIVFVNYVVTNTGTESQKLTALLVDVVPQYDDWPYMQGMDGIVDSALSEQLQVNSFALGSTGAEAPFVWAPGESFSYGDNFEYQAGSPITFTIGLTPSDDAGELMHDQKEALEVASTIK